MVQNENFPSSNIKILVVDDEPGINKLIQSALKTSGFVTFGASTGFDAIKWTTENPDNLLIIDFLLPDMNALELIDGLKSKKINFDFIVLTGFQDHKMTIEMMKKGARDYIIKDSDLIEIIPSIVNKTINEISNKKKLEEANEKIKNQYELLNGIISHLPNYIFWKDKSFNYLGCNEKFRQTFRFKFFL